MLKLQGITKEYIVGDQTVTALKGIDISFRDSEFVSVLGPSGCGKTTLLNIIGGLDRYTSGDMSINSVPTKSYTSADWDAYRNHSVGFVFQNYNLIPHQSVLSNVELALTLAGVSKSERRRRSIDVLNRVGLGDQLNKKPNQMSGGQMQRVAIARALVNDPDILLADEPTGALDTATSVQVMDLMREISKDRLVIMVTHNPELAEKYSTRIIRLLDGSVTDDSNPYSADTTPAKAEKRERTGMSMKTALSLSLNNLMTKKTRTLLTAFAGSIGIIGIALILSLSNGISEYINRVEEDTMSSYPITIEHETVDMSALLSTMMGNMPEHEEHEDGKVYSANIMGDMFNSMLSQVSTNDTGAFYEFINSGESGVKELTTDIQYNYSATMYVYGTDINGKTIQVNPNTVYQSVGMSAEMGGLYAANSSNSGMGVWDELIDNRDLLNSQYDVLAGRMPESYDEVVLFVDKYNSIGDFALYSLGLKDQSELTGIMSSALSGNEMPTADSEYTYEDLLSLKFRLVANTDYYQEKDGVWTDMRSDEAFIESMLKDAPELKVVGILRPNSESVNSSVTGTVGYTSELTRYLVDRVANSGVVTAQIENPDTDVLTGLPFKASGEGGMDTSSLNQAQLDYYNALSDAEKTALAALYGGGEVSDSTYEANMINLGVASLDSPTLISIYPKDFRAKEKLTQIIDDYNDRMTSEGKDDLVIQYTDYIEIVLSSVNTIVDAISYVLIAFVSISLIVSSIMIGIITYISVLERTKEIGILRAMGASKRDIGRVFNAETLIIGFTAGALGILVSGLLTIPINMIIKHLADISNVAQLPVAGAVILVLISMALTWIAGLIPSGIASRKDPVVALRTE